MNHQKEPALQLEHDTFAESAKSNHPLPCCIGYWRSYRSNDERAADDNSLEGLVQDTGREVLEIQSNIWELGHLRILLS
jgi:hypothetical protein